MIYQTNEIGEASVCGAYKWAERYNYSEVGRIDYGNKKPKRNTLSAYGHSNTFDVGPESFLQSQIGWATGLD